MPLWVASVVWMVRKLAAPGFRLRIAGFLMLTSSLPYYGAWGESLSDIGTALAAKLTAMVLLGLFVVLGLWLAFRPLPDPMPD